VAVPGLISDGLADVTGTEPVLDDGPTRVVLTMPTDVVKGAFTCDPNGKLLGGCGSWFGGPPLMLWANETGGSRDRPAQPAAIRVSNMVATTFMVNLL